jgi:hypothetical protein
MLFGATIVLKNSDGAVFIQMVYDHYIDLSFSQWWYELGRMLVFELVPGTKGDVFVHILSYITGSLLGFPELYFFLVSFIYAVFHIKSLSRILVWEKAPPSWLFWALIIVFISYRSIDNLQTVRTWTGLWVLFYGTFRYHQTHKPIYLLLMLSAPAFHFAYLLMALPAYVVIFIRRLTPKVFILIYFASFFVTIDPTEILQFLKTTELGERKVNGYYDESGEGHIVAADTNWYYAYGKYWSLQRAPNFLAVSIIIFGLYSRNSMRPLEIGLFSTGLLMASLANIGDFIPSFYSRTSVNAGIYITATTVLLLIRGELLRAKGYALLIRKLALWISIGAFIPYIVYVAANLIQFTSMFMLVLPFIGFFSDLNMSIRELIGFFM